MEWYKGSIPDAIAEVKNCQKVLLVFVIGNDELSNKMSQTYDDPVVSETLRSRNCVALKLVVDSVPYQQFSQIYPVVVIPSSFFIGKNGLPIEIITGSLESHEFVAKIDKIFQLNEENNGPRASGAAQSDVAQKSSSSQDVHMDSSEASSSSERQNGCESTNQPSTSKAESTSPEIQSSVEATDSSEGAANEVPLEDRVQRAKSLIETRRQSKAHEEQEDWVSSGEKCVSSLPATESGRKRKLEETEGTPHEKVQEQERRKLGKALQEAQQTREQIELKEWAQNRAKEKEEERLARERVRAQIAQDRAERAARYQQLKAEEVAAQKEKEMTRLKEEQEKSARDAAMRSTMARLQFRLPDGTSVTHQFPADSTLGEARTFVIQEVRPPFSNFTLCTTFPRRHFTEANYAETLRDLQLAPSAAVLVLPGQAVSVSNSEGSFFGNMFWMLISPLLAMWRAISSMFRRSSPQNENQPPVAASEPGPSGVQASSSSSSSSSSSKKSTIQKDGPVADGQAPGVRRRDPQKFYKEGNVFRISNQQTDDDDNNTWNGNSTQQM